MMEDKKASSGSFGSAQIEGFLGLFVANQKRIYAYILTLVPNCSDADDLLQETATVMWRKYSEFKVGTNFATWGMGIARNKILDFRRKQGKSRVQFNDKIFQLFLTRASIANDGIDRRLKALNVCLSKLGQHERQLINLRYEQDVATKSIAKQTGLSIHTVYKTIARIHDSLLRCIRRRLFQENIT